MLRQFNANSVDLHGVYLMEYVINALTITRHGLIVSLVQLVRIYYLMIA